MTDWYKKLATRIDIDQNKFFYINKMILFELKNNYSRHCSEKEGVIIRKVAGVNVVLEDKERNWEVAVRVGKEQP